MRIHKDGGTDRDEVEQHGGTLYFLYNTAMADAASVVLAVRKDDQRLPGAVGFFDLFHRVQQTVEQGGGAESAYPAESFFKLSLRAGRGVDQLDIGAERYHEVVVRLRQRARE